MKPTTVLVILGALAFSLVAGQPSTKEDHEIDLLREIFDFDAPRISPDKVFSLLRQLEEIYVKRNDDDKIPDGEKSRRMVIFTLAARGELSEKNCNKEYMAEFDQLAKYVAGFQNVMDYVDHFKAQQVQFCKEKDPSFTY